MAMIITSISTLPNFSALTPFGKSKWTLKIAVENERTVRKGKQMRKMTIIICAAVVIAGVFSGNVFGDQSCFPTFTTDYQLHIPEIQVSDKIYTVDFQYRDSGPGDGIWFELTEIKPSTEHCCSNPAVAFVDNSQLIIRLPLMVIGGQSYWLELQYAAYQGNIWFKITNYGLLPHQVFVTSVEGNGNLSTWPDANGKTGIEAGDAICQARARAAGLDGIFVAWLSDEQNDAYCRIHNLSGKKADNCGQDSLPVNAGPWVRTDGFPFAPAAGQFIEEGVVYSGLTTDEFSQSKTRYYFTGTGNNGIFYNSNGNVLTCKNWSDSEENNLAQGSTSTFEGTWSSGTRISCGRQFQLVCFETGPGPALPPVVRPGKKAFLTSIRGTGNLSSCPGANGKTGLEAGDEVCRSLARQAGLENADHFKALLSDDTTTTRDRIQSDGPWVRLDGIVLAENKDDLVNGRFQTILNLTEKGIYSNESSSWYAWTTIPGNAVQTNNKTCNNWQNDDHETQGHFSRVFDVSPWNANTILECDETHPFYCIED